MMGHRQVDQAALFYEFSLEKHIPADHLLRSIDRFVDLEQVRRDLAPFYSIIGRPSIDPDVCVCVPNTTPITIVWVVMRCHAVRRRGFTPTLPNSPSKAFRPSETFEAALLARQLASSE